jgi:hypothetical protein
LPLFYTKYFYSKHYLAVFSWSWGRKDPDWLLREVSSWIKDSGCQAPKRVHLTFKDIGASMDYIQSFGGLEELSVTVPNALSSRLINGIVGIIKRSSTLKAFNLTSESSSWGNASPCTVPINILTSLPKGLRVLGITGQLTLSAVRLPDSLKRLELGQGMCTDDSFWHTLRLSHIYLTDVHLECRASDALIGYLVSYSGLRSLSITQHSDLNTPRRKGSFINSVVRHHISTLESYRAEKISTQPMWWQPIPHLHCDILKSSTCLRELFVLLPARMRAYEELNYARLRKYVVSEMIVTYDQMLNMQ